MGQVGSLDDEREVRPSVRRQRPAIFQTFSDVVRQNGDWIDAHSGSFLCNFVLRGSVARITLGILTKQVDALDEIAVSGFTMATLLGMQRERLQA